MQQHKCSCGARRPRTVRLGPAGDHNGRAGDHKGRAGDHKGRAGDHKVVRATTRVAPTRVADLFDGVVGRLGLEPRTNGLKARCSTN